MNVGLAILVAVLWVLFNLLIIDAWREFHREKDDTVLRNISKVPHISKVQHHYNPMDDVQTAPLPRKQENVVPHVWDAPSLHRWRCNQARNQVFICDAESVVGYDQHGNIAYTWENKGERQ